RWAWSRKPEQIIWTEKATKDCLRAAEKMGSKYNQDPPLVQANNVRIKIARVATAMAMRLFSADDDLNCIVKPEHVGAAVHLMDRIYGMKGFGYLARSERKIKDKQSAQSNQDKAVDLLANKPEVYGFLE